MPQQAKSPLAAIGRNLIKDALPGAVRSFWLTVNNACGLASRELRFGRKVDLPLRRKIGLWRRGFLSESAVIYRTHDPERLADYLSDFARFQRTGRLNRPFDAILHDKLCFWGVVRNFAPQVAPAVGVAAGGRLIPLGSGGAKPLADGLAALPGRLVLKPCTGTGGTGIILYESRDGDHLADGAPIAAAELVRRLGRETYLVCPYVEQAAYARAIFPDVANTIRILTMYDEEAGEAFIAAAVHRFGRRRKGVVVDNWQQGGIAAGVDLASGRLSCGYDFPFAGRLGAFATHPDTGAAIEGALIDHWPAVRDGILGLANRLPFLPYVGWDVIVTDAGWTVIEGNNRSGINLFQLHRPLLADPRVRRFYERHGVVRPRPAGRRGPAPAEPQPAFERSE